MVDGVSTTELRRFTAIGLTHPSFTSDARGISRALGPHVGRLRNCDSGTPSWRVYQAEFELNSSLYPARLISPESRKRSSGAYAHDIYVAATRLSRIGPVLWIASPYMRLLDQIHDDLNLRLGSPAVKYLGVDMKPFYRHLSTRDVTDVVARRIILRILSEDNVELVSLTGKEPLHSKIHESLDNSTLPFGVGAQVEAGPKEQRIKARVTVYRTGMLYWYQSQLETIACPLSLISTLAGLNLLTTERLYPLNPDAQRADKTLGGEE